MSRRLALALAAAISTVALPSGAATGSDPELGIVRWGRDLDAALEGSRASGRPVLVLFDEVPGCATCVGFGQQVLSHPLLSEAIETEFVPLFVANNRPGRDAELLARFGEPAWNNPVMRFLDARGRDVLERRDDLYSAHEIAERLTAALRATGRPVPGYLALAAEETQQAHRQAATFVMGCFWEGEATLGAVPGVLSPCAPCTWIPGKACAWSTTRRGCRSPSSRRSQRPGAARSTAARAAASGRPAAATICTRSSARRCANSRSRPCRRCA